MAKIIRTDGTEEALPIVTLESLQQAVGGFIEMVGLADGRQLVVNEEGKLKGLPINEKACALTPAHAAVGDLIVGDVVLAEAGEID